jgi:hypothetical protein
MVTGAIQRKPFGMVSAARGFAVPGGREHLGTKTRSSLRWETAVRGVSCLHERSASPTLQRPTSIQTTASRPLTDNPLITG